MAIRIGDFVSARPVERKKGVIQSKEGRKEGIYLRKNSNTVTIQLLDTETLAKLNSREITEIEITPSMVHECWLNGATLAEKEDSSLKLTPEQLAILRTILKRHN